jgi:hypothetical protein
MQSKANKMLNDLLQRADFSAEEKKHEKCYANKCL